MGSYEVDTQRPTLEGVGYKNNHAAAEVAETEEVKLLKTKYHKALVALRELFVNWTDEDLLFALQEAEGDIELAAARISEGHASQWGEVKSKKHKKESSNKAKATGQQFGTNQRGHSRGGHNDRPNERGRPREGGNYRGGKFSSNDREHRQGQRRENGSGYNKPPRQQNGPNNSHSEESKTGGWAKWDSDNNKTGGNWADNETPSGTWTGNENSPSDNVPSNWASDDAKGRSNEDATDPAKGARGNDHATSTTNAKSTRSGEDAKISARGSVNTSSSNGAWSAGSITTDSSKDHLSAENASDGLANVKNDGAKDNWDTDTTKGAFDWSTNPSNETRSSESTKETLSTNNWGDKSMGDASQSPKTNTIKAVSKSPLPPKSRTIPAQSKTSWAQIVKPEPKPEPKPEAAPTPAKSSPEVQAISPRLQKPVTTTLQVSPATKTFESNVESTTVQSIPSPESSVSIPVIELPKNDEISKEFVKEVTPSEHSVPSVTSSPVVNASPRTKEISAPGLIKPKGSSAARKLKQEAPVVMPSTGAGLERTVQFGSLSLTSPHQESAELEKPISQIQHKVEEKSPIVSEVQLQSTPLQSQQLTQQTAQPQTVQAQQQTAAQVQQQQAAAVQAQVVAVQAQAQQQTNLTHNNVPRLPGTTSNNQQSAIPSATNAPTHGNVPNPTPGFNPSYFKQDQTSAAYLGQQPHLGLGEPSPYASYQPNQLSGFGIGPMQSLPEYGYPEQRMMAYYDPAAYGQASPVTSNAYQGRDSKYTPETSSTATNQTSNQTTASQQQSSTNQQGGQQTPQQQQQQQQAYPALGMPYYPYYYMNQFSPAYQQSGYGQHFVNKSMYPLYHSTKPGSGSAASPYGYQATPSTPNAPPHQYSHSSNAGYDEVTGAGIHHLPGVIHDYQKQPYGGGNSIPQSHQLQNFLNSNSNNNQPSGGSAGTSSNGGKGGSNGSELSSPAQYKYDKSSSSGQQGGGVSQSAGQHQQPGTPYYGQQQAQQQQQQQQQMFNNYQYQQAHHQQYHPQHQTHQATNRSQQYWNQQS